jgi:hypothetical protein
MRRLFVNFFIFKVNKKTLIEIFDEILEQDDKDLISDVSKIAFSKPHNFLYINSDNNRIFINHDELLISE